MRLQLLSLQSSLSLCRLLSFRWDRQCPDSLHLRSANGTALSTRQVHLARSRFKPALQTINAAHARVLNTSQVHFMGVLGRLLAHSQGRFTLTHRSREGGIRVGLRHGRLDRQPELTMQVFGSVRPPQEFENVSSVGSHFWLGNIDHRFLRERVGLDHWSRESLDVAPGALDSWQPCLRWAGGPRWRVLRRVSSAAD